MCGSLTRSHPVVGLDMGRGVGGLRTSLSAFLARGEPAVHVPAAEPQRTPADYDRRRFRTTSAHAVEGADIKQEEQGDEFVGGQQVAIDGLAAKDRKSVV